MAVIRGVDEEDVAEAVAVRVDKHARNSCIGHAIARSVQDQRVGPAVEVGVGHERVGQAVPRRIDRQEWRRRGGRSGPLAMHQELRCHALRSANDGHTSPRNAGDARRGSARRQCLSGEDAGRIWMG